MIDLNANLENMKKLRTKSLQEIINICIDKILSDENFPLISDRLKISQLKQNIPGEFWYSKDTSDNIPIFSEFLSNIYIAIHGPVFIKIADTSDKLKTNFREIGLIEDLVSDNAISMIFKKWETGIDLKYKKNLIYTINTCIKAIMMDSKNPPTWRSSWQPYPEKRISDEFSLFMSENNITLKTKEEKISKYLSSLYIVSSKVSINPVIIGVDLTLINFIKQFRVNGLTEDLVSDKTIKDIFERWSQLIVIRNNI